MILTLLRQKFSSPKVAIGAAACGCIALVACSIAKTDPDDDGGNINELLGVADSLYNANKPSSALALQQLASFVVYDDIERFRVCMEMAQTHYFMGNIEATRQLVDECVAYFDTTEAFNIECKRLHMDALCLQAELLDAEGHRAKATEQYLRAAGIAHNIADLDTYVSSMRYVCANYMRTGKYSEAINGFNDLLQTCQKNNMDGLVGNLLDQLITAYLAVDDHEMAAKVLNTMVETLDMNNDIYRGMAWINKMRIAINNWDLAEQDTCAAALKAMCDNESQYEYLGYHINDLLADHYINTDSVQYAPKYIRNLASNFADDTPEEANHIALLWGEYYIATMKLDSVELAIKNVDGELLRNTNIDLYQRYVYVNARLYYRQKDYRRAYSQFKEHSQLADLFAKERLAHAHAFQTLAFRRDTTIIAQHFRLRKQEEQEDNLNMWFMVSAVALGVVLSIIFLIFVYIKVSAVKQREREIAQHNDKLQREVVRQTAILKKQETALKLKQDNLRSQLYYAGNIQQSILPDLGKITSTMVKGVFALFRPCNPVSGDFYWINESEGRLLMACADATGHGVPGAIIAMMYSTLLNNLSQLHSEQPTVDMLDQLDTKINGLLTTNKTLLDTDCIDISMLCVDSNTGRITLSLARHNAYIVRHGSTTPERISGTRRSVGDMQETFRLRPFMEHELQMEQGDMLYLTTDGYESQLGGPDNIKMRRSDMENLLGKIASLPLDEQRKRLEDFSLNWQGQNEQTDDVLVMGIKF